MVFVVVAVCVLLVWLVFRRFRTDPTFVSPVPGLGCALAFKNDPVKFLCDVARNSSSFGAVTLNMAGLHLRWLLDADEARLFYKAKEDQMSSFGALHKIGFAKTLGSLNVNVGGSLHASKLRGSSVQTSINNMMVHRCLHLMEEHKSKSLELYKFCRELVLSVMVEFFVGPQRPGFHERYLQFQRVNLLEKKTAFVTNFQKQAHESAIAIAMSIGKTLAWPWLRSAEQKRLRLISEIELTSEYALGLGDEFCKAQKADLCIGLLTAATKNVAIGLIKFCDSFLFSCHSLGSADAIVFCLQHRKDEISIPHAVLETLRMTCLTFGALRMAMRFFFL